jgi:hypothetical protein
MPQAEKPNSTSRLSRRSALAGLSVAAAAGVAALPAGAIEAGAADRLDAAAALGRDPIFAAIAAHEVAMAAYRGECNSDADIDAKLDAASDLEFYALYDLIVCRPTTLAGVAAMLDHLARPQYGEEAPASVPEFRETILSGAVGWGGDIRAAAHDLPRVLAETVRSLIGGQK